jgi:LPXTG-motif cell wall-anchored protein
MTEERPETPPGVKDAPAGPDLRIAVSPAQAAVGFGIIASLILLVLRRRRKRG